MSILERSQKAGGKDQERAYSHFDDENSWDMPERVLETGFAGTIINHQSVSAGIKKK